MTATDALHPSDDAVRADRLLQWGAVAFTVFVLLHNGDHTRRGLDVLSTDVVVAGTLAIFVEIGIVAVIIAGHRLAPLAAAATGFGLAAGYVLVHLLPGRGWLSDPLFDGGGEGLSQAAAIGEIAAAVALGVAGVLALRARGGLASTAVDRPTRPLAEVMLHPVVATMALGNVVLYVLGIVG